MDLKSALGTPVLNFSVNPDISDEVFKGLIMSYIELGGMQAQITCVSKEKLEKAYEKPEDYKNIVVRVGGYSEYFYRLPDELKKVIIARTVH